MQVYLIPIQSAVLCFPFLAAVLTLPYAFRQYRKFGSIMMLRVAIVYSFVFYLLCAYFLVILPLPPIEEVAQYQTPTMQLIPFSFVEDLRIAWQGSLLHWIKQPAFYQAAFNLLLLFPLGLYLRYYFQCSIKKTILLSFLVSLSFECLQLSGLLGVYPRPYRLFDVDDLLINTLGGTLGCLCTPLFAYFLPKRDVLDKSSYHKGTSVSGGRRIFALGIDFLSLVLCSVLCNCLLSIFVDPLDVWDQVAIFLLCFFFLEILFPFLTHGQTLGKKVMKIKLVQKGDQPISFLAICTHFILRDLSFLAAPYWIYLSVVLIFHDATAPYLFLCFLLVLYIIYVFLLLFQSISALYQVKVTPLYNRFWNIHNISLIVVPDVDEQKEPEEKDATLQQATTAMETD